MNVTSKARLLSAAAFLAAAALSPVTRAGESIPRLWTLEDILMVPEVTEIALASNGRAAVYVVEQADPASEHPQSSIHIVDLAAKTERRVANATIAKLIKRIPGTSDWSGLLDMGDGLQLYRISQSGAIAPLMINPDTVAVGRGDLSFPISGSPPHRVGVLAYDWSPDGRWLWYSVLREQTGAPRVRFDEAVASLGTRRRSQIEVEIAFQLRDPGGHSETVVVRPSTDRMAVHAGANIVWNGDQIEFRVENANGTTGSAFETLAWNRRTKALRTLTSEQDAKTMLMLQGPRGGRLNTEGAESQNRLLETLADGRRHDYGGVDFIIGDPRAVGTARSADGGRVIMGTRSLAMPSYGLAFLDRNGLREIRSKFSLTQCGFDEALRFGVCVEQGMTRPPRLVRVDLESGKISPILPISPRHEAIVPLEVKPRTWVNRHGYKATGYVVLPRAYRPGRRYPTVIVTHGGDADDRFSDVGNQWNYPVQLLAERGYVVLLINDPAPNQTPEQIAAYRAWGQGKGPLEPEALQRLIWINGVHSFEDAIDELVEEGLVDRDRVGIAGYSRGSQMVNVAITRSSYFRAASSGDGGFLEPAAYAASKANYDSVYGGAPLSDHFPQYRQFAPSLNADKICAPVLQQVAAASPAQVEFFEAVRAAGVPTQLSYYPGAIPATDETHIFYIPRNRLLAMRENIAWFDYWLLGKRDPAMPFPERLAEWDKMAQAMPDRCATVLDKPG
ncbi:prolyl oligopeptidase family serine peptidase [Sphingopyxis sp. C-1]|uniref:prolyl oligopeptidase family serine peptidase n=1 Tax=Sphingopyxis sp. C-1 TaxID=262667 RepID=UPI0006BFB401|nr:prolyl oligopeptidase family serine peptidase [Sphingopyxis sp. C-1]GAO77434.1 alanyl dipeptidyl peptidase [Sphingopyxis sp. C-1]